MNRRLRNLVGLALAALVGATLTVALPAGANGDDDDGEFRLGGTAQHARDPENSANDVIRIRTDQAPPFGTVSRKLGVKVLQLDNMLSVKAWFESPKTCIGGSPRFQLAIDTDGNGQSDGNAFGYFGTSPNFAACPMNTWLYEDLTGGGDSITGLGPTPSTGFTTPNEELEWDLTQFAGAFYNTWSQVEAFFAAFPNHQVCSGALVDDTFGAPGMSGTAYYDEITIGDETWTEFDDTRGRGGIPGCKKKDKDDDD